MSERFVEGFLVAPKKLAALLGTPAAGFKAIEKALGKKQIFEDLVMSLGDGDEEAGLEEAKAGLDALAAGKVPSITYVERLTQLVLHAHAEHLEPSLMECNYMPADDDGLWTPAFTALGMKTIAKGWGRPNLAFPRKRAKVDFGWPVITLVEKPATWKTELAKPWRKKLATLPNSTFDPDADDDAEDVFMSRAEVEHGIAALEKWVRAACKRTASKKKAVAKSGNALVLIYDGDQ